MEALTQNFDEWGDAESPSVNFADDNFSPEEQEETINELMEEVRERINKLRQRGIAEYLLEQLIHPDNRLSRLVITKDWRILLPDYNDMEIKMEPLVKAVYLNFPLRFGGSLNSLAELEAMPILIDKLHHLLVRRLCTKRNLTGTQSILVDNLEQPNPERIFK